MKVIVPKETVRESGYLLSVSRYMQNVNEGDDDVEFADKIDGLYKTLADLQNESERLDKQIAYSRSVLFDQ